MKILNRFCPVCNELYQDLEYAKISIAAKVQINMRCPNNHKWSEFYSLYYQGYWFNGKHYDSYGEEKIKEVKENE